MHEMPFSSSGCADLAEEAVHIRPQFVRLAAEIVGGGEHLPGSRAGLLSRLVHPGNIGCYSVGAFPRSGRANKLVVPDFALRSIRARLTISDKRRRDLATREQRRPDCPGRVLRC